MTDLLTRENMDGLSVQELQTLLNKQIAAKRLLQDRRSENIAQFGNNATNINNLRAKIGSLSEGDVPVEVSDHAMLRYLQRAAVSTSMQSKPDWTPQSFESASSSTLPAVTRSMA